VWLFCWLPGIFALNVRLPVLVDAPSFALAIGAAVAWQRGEHPMALSLAIASGLCKESGPVFAALFAQNPFLLIGTVPHAVRPWFRGATKGDEPWLAHPFREARKARDVLSFGTMVLPWGSVALLACLGAHWDRATLLAMIALAIGYGQLLIAQDAARLYQWAAPTVLVLAARADVGVWLLPLLVAHPFLANMKGQS
jgi:hypothetical protein